MPRKKSTEESEVIIGVSLMLPVVPDSIALSVGNESRISIKDVSDTDLKAIGKQWAQALLDRARELRKPNAEQ